jgi:hypothetical protein
MRGVMQIERERGEEETEGVVSELGLYLPAAGPCTRLEVYCKELGRVDCHGQTDGSPRWMNVRSVLRRTSHDP